MSNIENNSNTEIETTNMESVMEDTNEGTEQEGSEDGVLEASAEETEESVEAAPAEGDKAGEAEKEAAHLAFVAAAQAHAEALGLQSKDQKGFFQFFNGTTGHKLYVAKQTKGVTRIDTTLPMDQLGAIALPLDKPNGRIQCHVLATQEAVSTALDLLASYGEKIPSPRKAAKVETVTAAPAAE